MGYRKRTDANHGDVIETLRAAGWTVRDTSRFGEGFPDAIAAKPGRVVFVEIKDGSKPPSKRKLTPDEEKFADLLVYGGAEYRILTSADEAGQL